jgi:hypothetical protein
MYRSILLKDLLIGMSREDIGKRLVQWKVVASTCCLGKCVRMAELGCCPRIEAWGKFEYNKKG